MAKIVIDANMVISAAFGGKPLEVMARAMGNHEVYYFPSIELELHETILGLSKKLSEDRIDFVREKIAQLLAIGKRIAVSTHVILSRDTKDDHYLSLCKEANADFLITGDKDLLNIPRETLDQAGISCMIITPLQFLEQRL